MTELADREWRLIREDVRPGPMQMALDEIAAETAAAGGPRTVRVYRWEPSCLSLGYTQATDTVDWEFCEANNIDVTRRQTGGGGIYHDYDGDISYSIVAPKSELPGNLMDCYELLCAPILTGFDRMGVPAAFVEQEHPAIYEPACYLRGLHPAHDIVANGRKISGNAQYRRADAVIQHGSLTYHVDAKTHLDVFADPDAADGSVPVSVDRFRDRVTGIDEESDISRAKAVSTLEETLGAWVDAVPGEWTDEELSAARDRVEEKYGSDSWVLDRSSSN